MDIFLNIAVPTTVILALLMAIYFWIRGIEKSCLSDLLAGPLILTAICLCFIYVYSSSAYAATGGFITIFGVISLVFSGKALPGGKITKNEVRIVGVLAIFLGFCLLLVL